MLGFAGLGIFRGGRGLKRGRTFVGFGSWKVGKGFDGNGGGGRVDLKL